MAARRISAICSRSLSEVRSRLAPDQVASLVFTATPPRGVALLSTESPNRPPGARRPGGASRMRPAEHGRPGRTPVGRRPDPGVRPGSGGCRDRRWMPGGRARCRRFETWVPRDRVAPPPAPPRAAPGLAGAHAVVAGGALPGARHPNAGRRRRRLPAAGSASHTRCCWSARWRCSGGEAPGRVLAVAAAAVDRHSHASATRRGWTYAVAPIIALFTAVKAGAAGRPAHRRRRAYVVYLPITWFSPTAGRAGAARADVRRVAGRASAWPCRSPWAARAKARAEHMAEMMKVRAERARARGGAGAPPGQRGAAAHRPGAARRARPPPVADQRAGRRRRCTCWTAGPEQAREALGRDQEASAEALREVRGGARRAAARGRGGAPAAGARAWPTSTGWSTRPARPACR